MKIEIKSLEDNMGDYGNRNPLWPLETFLIDFVLQLITPLSSQTLSSNFGLTLFDSLENVGRKAVENFNSKLDSQSCFSHEKPLFFSSQFLISFLLYFLFGSL